MRNLFRMDIRRLVRSKSVYICIGVLVLFAILQFLLLYAVVNPDIQEMLKDMGVTVRFNTPSGLEGIKSITILQLMEQNGIRGGVFAMMTGILAALFLCAEYESGFVKNVMSLYQNKWKYVFSKLGCLCLVNLVSLILLALIPNLLNLALGNYFIYNTPGEMMIYLASVWMLENAFSALYLLVCMATRSKAAGVAAGILLGTGTLAMLLSGLLGVFGLDHMLNHTIYGSLNACPMRYQKPEDLIPLLTGLGFLILYTAAAGIVVQRRDV